MADANTTATAIPKPSMKGPVTQTSRRVLTPLLTLFLSPSGDQTARRITPSVSIAQTLIEYDTKVSRASGIARNQIKQRKIEALPTPNGDTSAPSWELAGFCTFRLTKALPANGASSSYSELLGYAQSFSSAPSNIPDLMFLGQPPPPLFFSQRREDVKMKTQCGSTSWTTRYGVNS